MEMANAKTITRSTLSFFFVTMKGIRHNSSFVRKRSSYSKSSCSEVNTLFTLGLWGSSI